MHKIMVCVRSTDANADSSNAAAGESRIDSENENVTTSTTETETATATGTSNATSNAISITISYSSDCVTQPCNFGGEVSRNLVTTTATVTVVCSETSGKKYQAINAKQNSSACSRGLGLFLFRFSLIFIVAADLFNSLLVSSILNFRISFRTQRTDGPHGKGRRNAYAAADRLRISQKQPTPKFPTQMVNPI